MLQEFFGEYYNVIGGVSLGTITLVFWRIMTFFKKDKYLLPFVNIAKTKTIEVIGKMNYDALINIAKDIKIEDIPTSLKEFADTQLIIMQLLKLLLQNQLALGVYDDNPELKETIESLL